MPDNNKNETEDDENNVIDYEVFSQILEMDEDDDKEFSRTIVYDFFDQASSEIEEKDYMNLSKSGHFLKGSSAALGLTKMKDTCENIQNLGKENNEEVVTNDIEVDEDFLTEQLQTLKKQFKMSKTHLKKIYNDAELSSSEENDSIKKVFNEKEENKQDKLDKGSNKQNESETISDS